MTVEGAVTADATTGLSYEGLISFDVFTPLSYLPRKGGDDGLSFTTMSA